MTVVIFVSNCRKIWSVKKLEKIVPLYTGNLISLNALLMFPESYAHLQPHSYEVFSAWDRHGKPPGTRKTFVENIVLRETKQRVSHVKLDVPFAIIHSV